MDWSAFIHYIFLEEYNLLWVMMVLYTLFVSFNFYRFSKSSNILPTASKLNFRYFLFIGSFGVSKFIFFFSNYLIEHDLGDTLEYNIYYLLGNILNLGAMGFLIYAIEKDLLNHKGWLASLPVIHIVLLFILKGDQTRYITMLFTVFYYVIVGGMYFGLIFKTTGTIKKMAGYSLLGFTLLGFGYFLDNRVIKLWFVDHNLGIISYLSGPLLAIAGIYAFYYGNRLNKFEL